MEEILKLYTYKGESVASTPFPNELEQVVITDFQYDANRMGGAPSISAKIMHRLCLDDLWTDNVYAEFNGERYFVMNTPSSNKDNDDTRYEHEIELLSEREVLNHIYFIDAVQGDSTVDVYKSNSTKVIFMGDINEFASRLNSSLSYSKVGYNVVVDEGIVTEAKLVSFEDKYIMSALQEIFNIYEIPYYFDGKTIHIGYTDNAIPNVFKYGFDDALLSISKNNANYEVVRRCSGIGSSDNIPYYYPNESDDRAAIEASGKKWITPSQNLMPPIYRETEGAERFYNAENNKYESPEGGYYTFENLYSTRTPNEKIVSFEDIKPSIVGMTNASGQRIDQFLDIAFDENDNDEIDEDGNYIHPYFFVKLPKYNGSFGFNLFDHASEQGAMTISMTSGVCGACNFEIGVGEETNKNIVQVDDSGNLKRDENGNVLWENQVPQYRQNDTQNYEVWIALKKDDSTYGQIMPNATQNLKPSVGDTFVILNINLPQSYILAAEEKLKDSIIKYMFLNNNERFTFSVNFSRIYFAENPDVLAMMNENARILIEYNGKQHTLYISSFFYKMSSDSPLPEISVELTDELSVGQNSLQNALDQVKNDILSSIGGSDFLKQGLKYFIRKDIADTARGKITFKNGLDVGTFSANLSGGTFRLDEQGKSYLEVDRLFVRLQAIFEELQIKKVSHIGGEQIISPASMTIKRVEETDTYYRCYATESDEEPYEMEFAIDDQAISKNSEPIQQEDGSYTLEVRNYWRLVIAVGANYVDLSKTDVDATMNGVPQVGDDIIHLGNRKDINRQNAIMLSSVSIDAPSIKLLKGINSFDLTDKEMIVQGFESYDKVGEDGEVIETIKKAVLKVYGDLFVGEKGNEKSYMKYDSESKKLQVQGGTIRGSKIEGGTIRAGYEDEVTKEFVTKSGFNGDVKQDVLGGGISYFSGGDEIDREAFVNPEEIPTNAATALIRMDGSGYFAKGNLTWDKDGILHADPLSFFVGEDTVGDLLRLFAPIYDESDRETIIGISARYPLAVQGGITAYAGTPISLPNIFTGLMLDPNTLKWNEKGELTVIGGTGGGEADSVEWNNIKNIPTWITDTKPTYNWSEIKNTPTTLSGYGITDAYKIISGTPDTNKGMSAGYWDGIGSYASFVGNNWGGQFKMDSTEVLSYRTVKNGVVGSWKTIAFTTSTVGNADKLDNFHETDFFRKDRFKLSTVNSTLYSLNGTAIDTSNPNYTGLYVGFNANASNSTILLHLETGNSPKLKYNYAIDSNKLGSSWREFAFIDSNVASATKLQTSRNIWGKSFDGTANVNGRWELDGNNGGKLSIFDSGTYRSIQSYGGALCINVEGNNVGIGTSTAAYKLTVKGECSVSDKIITNNFFECAKNNGVILSKTGHTNTKLISWVWEGGYGDSVIFDIPGNSTLSRRMRLCSDTGLIITGNLIVEGNILSRGGVTAYASGSGSDVADQFSVKKLNVVGSNNSNSYISADSTSNMFFNWGGKTGLVLSGTAIRSGNAYPCQFDLGSSQTPFKDLYLKGLTINSSPTLSDTNMVGIRTDINNPFIGFRHNSKNWYVQGYNGQLQLGPGSTKSVKIDVNGNMSVYGKVTESSDKRLKSDIKPLANRGYIEPKTFVKDGIKYIGFIAQDVQKLYPELVVEDNTEEHYLSLSYSQYVAVLQAQIIELNERINNLEQLNN